MTTLYYILGGLVLVGAVILVICVWGYSQRRKHLTAKYGDVEIARRLMKHVVWQGETREQLLDSLGEALDVDQKVLKTKTKEVWKYRRIGANRFGLKITLDDGVVTAWERTD